MGEGEGRVESEFAVEATLERRTLDATEGEGGLAGEVDVLRAAGEADVGEDRLKRRREADGDDGSAAAEDARRVVFDPLIVAGRCESAEAFITALRANLLLSLDG